jgi:RNA polymerase-binding transcription factor DksA
MAEATRKTAAPKKTATPKKGAAAAKAAKKAKKPAVKTPAAKAGAGKKGGASTAAKHGRAGKRPAKPTKKATAKTAKKPEKAAPTKKPKASKPAQASKKKASAAPAAKKAPPAKKGAPAKKAPPAKKPAPVKAAPPAKKPAPAKAVPQAKKAPAPTLPPAKKAPPRKPGSVICPLSGWEVMPAKPNLSTRTLKRLRDKLIDERNQQLHSAEELQAEAEELAQERDPGDTQFDEESGEGDTVNVERERDLLLSASARQIVDAIDRAVARMEAGTYGVCVPAGRRLSLERLEAIPYAEECVDCKARAERRR